MTITKNGISAKEIQQQLEHNRYEPVCYMLSKIRVSLGARDDRSKLKGFTEMDEVFLKQ
jgi:hypothetical protein